MKNYLELIAIICLFLLLLRVFRKPIRTWAYNLKGRLMIVSLRGAIKKADQDKKKTGRKNMVVFNRASGELEPVQKKLLKMAAKMSKNKSNAAMTKGRKRMMTKNKRKKTEFSTERVKQIEKKSLYVTR